MYELIYTFYGEIHRTDFNSLEELLWYAYQFIKKLDMEAEFYIVEKENISKSGFSKSD